MTGIIHGHYKRFEYHGKVQSKIASPVEDMGGSRSKGEGGPVLKLIMVTDAQFCECFQVRSIWYMIKHSCFFFNHLKSEINTMMSFLSETILCVNTYTHYFHGGKFCFIFTYLFTFWVGWVSHILPIGLVFNLCHSQWSNEMIKTLFSVFLIFKILTAILFLWVVETEKIPLKI
jgi:hypothetical protein